MKNYIYLDNAATSFPKPGAVAKAVRMTIERGGGNPGRGGSRMAVKAARTVFAARTGVAELLRLPHPERVVFTKNATEGINVALFGLATDGMRIGTSNVEHNAVIRPLTALSRLRGVTVVSVPCDAVGLPDADALPDDIGLLVTTAASNVTGGIADIPRLAAACRAKGIALVVDAAQAAGSIPLDFSGVAAVAAAGHKGLLGPQGTGFVWFAPGVEPAPYLYGGTGSDSDATAMPDYWPDRFEAGTVNTPGLAGLAAGVAWITKKGIAAVREQETAFCETILNRMVDDDRIAVYPPFPAAARASLICFNVIGRDPAEVADAFDRRGFAVRAGLHCSPDGHRFIGTFPTGAVRVSPGPLTKAKQVAAFLTALDRIAKET